MCEPSEGGLIRMKDRRGGRMVEKPPLSCRIYYGYGYIVRVKRCTYLSSIDSLCISGAMKMKWNTTTRTCNVLQRALKLLDCYVFCVLTKTGFHMTWWGLL